METPDKTYTDTLEALQRSGNLRNLPQAGHRDKWMIRNGTGMLNLSSNDYLGLASDLSLRDEFMKGLSERDFLLSASSSRLLTGNFPVHDELEKDACLLVRTGRGTGLLQRLSPEYRHFTSRGRRTHPDTCRQIGTRQPDRRHPPVGCKCIRYRHQDYTQLQTLLEKHHHDFSRIIIVTESIFSMDGDMAPPRPFGRAEKISQRHALRRRSTCRRSTRTEGVGNSRRTRLPEGHRLPVRHVRQSTGLSRGIRGMQPNDKGVSGQPHAYIDLHHGPASLQYRVDKVRAIPSGHMERAPQPARQTFAPRTASDTREWQILPVFEPHHSRGNRRKPRHHPESGGYAAQRILRPARSSAHRTGGTSRLRISLTAALTAEETDRLCTALATL